MATNPNRPQYQDVIESSWGQAVADTVVRRYDTTAERDADLPFAPDVLAGQVVAITGPPAALYMHDGVSWGLMAGPPKWHAKVYQAGAATIGAASAIFYFDSIAYDPAAMWVPAAGHFVIPEPGLWQVSGQLTGSAVATGQVLYSQVNVQGQPSPLNTAVHNGTNRPWGTPFALPVEIAAAGAQVSVSAGGEPGNTGMISGLGACYFSVDYLGPPPR